MPDTKTLHKIFQSEIKELNEDERTIIHYISSETPDRMNDIIVQEGIDFSNFQSNPVVCYNHFNGMQNISDKWTILGRSLWQKIENGKTLVKTQIYRGIDLADDFWTAVQQGYRPSWSIGYSILSDPIFKGAYRIIKDSELLEYSNVIVPMHTDATSIAFKNFEPKSFEFKNIKHQILMEDKVLALETKASKIEADFDNHNKEFETLSKSYNELVARVEALENPVAILSKCGNELATEVKEIPVTIEAKSSKQEETKSKIETLSKKLETIEKYLQ